MLLGTEKDIRKFIKDIMDIITAHRGANEISKCCVRRA